MKYRMIIFWGIVGCCLFVLLQYRYSFFFFYVDQLQLFPLTKQFLTDTVCQPGGFAYYVAGFLQQFYILPYIGTLITVGLLMAVGLLSQSVFKQLTFTANTYLLASLILLVLLPLHTDMHYRIQGTIAFLFLLFFMLVYIRIKRSFLRVITGFMLLPLLFCLAGPVMVLFGISMLLWELLQQGKRWYYAFGFLVEIVIICLGTMYEAWQGELRMILLPDFYYERLLRSDKLYYLWILFPAGLLLSWFLRGKKNREGKNGWILFAAQLFPFFIFLYWEGNKKATFEEENRRLDYYLRNEQWDMIISSFSPDKVDMQTLNVLNLALACKGELGDKLFDYPQLGRECLFPEWDSTLPGAIVLSDIWYHIGDIATAQKYAFEGYVASTAGNPRLLQRLVQTNLIQGAYSVAEKYIRILEQTLFYRGWAYKHRKYLYNDKILAQDLVLGDKRKAQMKENQDDISASKTKILELLAVNNPANRVAFQYLTSYLLLGKNLNIFKELHHAYYHTKIWPSLSVSEQEAIIALEQDNPSCWAHKGVSLKVEQHFGAFNQDMKEKHSFLDFKDIMASSYGNTYWFYLMFKK